MPDLPCAHHVERGGAAAGDDAVSLDYEGRFLRRRRLVSDSGRAFLVDLAEVTSLDDGDALIIDDGSRVAVRAAPEALLCVEGEALPRLAWHIGNRHTPCRIEADRLLIRDDHVLAGMLRGLGAQVTPLVAPFQPEGGAYGHGRTLGHSHSHEERGPSVKAPQSTAGREGTGNEAGGHDHGHGHEAGHAHGHGHEAGHAHGHGAGHEHQVGQKHAHDVARGDEPGAKASPFEASGPAQGTTANGLETPRIHGDGAAPLRGATGDGR